MTPIPVLISRDPGDGDFLEVLEYGRVTDGQPADAYEELSGSFRFCLDPWNGDVVGFQLRGLAEFDVDLPEHEPLWGEPRFHAPTLGLPDACAGELVLAARAELLDRHTLNRVLFHWAVRARGEDAEELWQQCLETGDMSAHFSLGYTLLELDQPHRGYRHLRRYTELVPANSWAWCWLGQAAVALGNPEEARAHFERAIALASEGSYETDAPDLLEELRS